MEMMFSKQIGKHKLTFTVDGNNLFELVQKSQQIGFQDVYKCGLCESDKLYVRSYLTEEDHYEYVKIHCAECKATITFGKAKKDGAFFLRKTEDGKLAWEKARERVAEEPRQAVPAASKAEKFEKTKKESMSKEDDLPF